MSHYPPHSIVEKIDYKLLIDPLRNTNQSSVAEKPSGYNCLKERHLQAMWIEQKYFRQLTTSQGIPIQVISPGVWNGEAGPDFLKAHLLIGDLDLKGDIEIHLFDDGWYHHGHHHNEKYNNLILHIGLWRPKQEIPIITSQGKTILTTHFQDSLTIPEAKIFKLIDLDLYPYKHFVGCGRCSRTLFSTLSQNKASALFTSAAEWRLTQKRQQLLAKYENNKDALAGGIAMALGYKQNTEKFGDLYLALKKLKLTDENEIFSTALALTGFFLEPYRTKWGHSPAYLSLLHANMLNNLSPDLPKIKLQCNNIRPANHPVRRLAVLSKLLLDNHIDNLEAVLLEIWRANWNNHDITPKKRWKTIREELIKALPVYTDAYWQHHYTFEEKRKTEPIALLGEDLKREILINVCLPLIYEYVELNNHPEEILFFQQFYNSLPASSSAKKNYLQHRLFGDKDKKTLLDKADMQQGAYQLHRDFCINYEASCVGCPFVDRFVSAFGR